jgi:hypothetical protein
VRVWVTAEGSDYIKLAAHLSKQLFRNLRAHNHPKLFTTFTVVRRSHLLCVPLLVAEFLKDPKTHALWVKSNIPML